MDDRLRGIFFGVNTSVALLAIAGGILVSLDGDSSPFAFLGAVCFVWPALAFAIAEVMLYVGKRRALERPLGLACGGVAALAMFALVTNGAEALVAGGSPGMTFWIVFGGACISIASYGGWCCWWRVIAQSAREPRGFPVGPPKGILQARPTDE